MSAKKATFLVGWLVAWSAASAGEPATPGPSVQSEWARLNGLYEQGYYQVAADKYRALRDREGAEDAAARIAVGLSRCLDQLGRYEDAIRELRAAEQPGRNSPDWQEALACELVRVGRYEQAIEHCRAGLKLREDHMACRVRLGELYELLGRKDHAVETYEWFNELLQDALPEGADELVLAGRGFYRYSVLSQHPNLRERTRYVLHELFQFAYERVDRRNWRARLASGNLLLDKYNLEEAVEEFEAALRLNPYLADAHVGLARAALVVWDFERAEQKIRRALRLNPRHHGALNVRAELAMTERKYAKAARACRDALEINPHDIAALSTLAAAQMRLGKPAASQETQARVHKINPRCAELDFTLARWLSAARQFAPAEKHFLRAVELAPEWSAPLTELGRMYMETGQERSAENMLKQAWELDPFNHRTYNTLDLLETLASFKTVESEHFIIKFDAERDAPIAPYLIRYLESIYRELSDDYGIELQDRTIIEVFPTHAQFGVRITGRPWIHTIGASTGPVIAIDAPRPSSGYGRYFNWADVLRHEFTHTVTLAATHNRIPHWLTEGLAVWQEDAPRGWSWIRLLAGALRENRMFTLQSIDWGFIRPERPTDRQLAYAQSEWMVEYIVLRWGYQVIGKLIEVIRDGLSQEDAFAKVLEMTPADFSADFVRWARQEARPWGLAVDPLPSPIWLKAMRVLKPNDADNHARLAESLLLSGNVEEAGESAKRALDLDPHNTLALETLSRLVLMALDSETDKDRRRQIEQHAVNGVRRLLDLDPDNHAGLKLQAAIALDHEREDEAVRLYRRLRAACPSDPVSYRVLASLALERGDKDRALGNLVDLWNYQAEDADVPMRISTLLADRGRDHEALVWLERGVHIDPYRTDLHERLGALYSRFNRWEDAAVEYEVLSGLEPKLAEHVARLAMCYSRLGRKADARAAAREAVELDPNSPARSLLEE